MLKLVLTSFLTCFYIWHVPEQSTRMWLDATSCLTLTFCLGVRACVCMLVCVCVYPGVLPTRPPTHQPTDTEKGQTK